MEINPLSYSDPQILKSILEDYNLDEYTYNNVISFLKYSILVTIKDKNADVLENIKLSDIYKLNSPNLEIFTLSDVIGLQNLAAKQLAGEEDIFSNICLLDIKSHINSSGLKKMSINSLRMIFEKLKPFL